MRNLGSVLLTFMFTLPANGLAAGLQTLEQGTDDVGRAMVGAASLAHSAATAFYNPAGMTRLSEPELQTGAMLIVGKSEFDPDGATTVVGGDGGNAFVNALAPGGLFYVRPIGEKAAVGLSAVAPFVGSLDYSKNWVGRYFVQTFKFSVYAAGPSVAYKVTDKLSIGLQGYMNYAKIDVKAAINFGGGAPATPAGDGQIHIDSADMWQPGWGAGVHWMPTETTRIGVAYKSAVDLDDLGGDLKIRGLPFPLGAGAELGFKLPQSVNFSVSHDLTEALTVSADFGWADFSEFDFISVDISVTGAGPNFKTGFRDSVAYGVAARYRLTPEWLLQAGTQYASSPVSNSNRNVSLPFDRQIRVGAGVVYRWREDVDLALSYEFLDLGDAKITSPMANGDLLSGDYDRNYAHFFALSFQKRF